MMRAYFWIGMLLLGLIDGEAKASSQEPSSAWRLRRLSYRIRALPPTSEEIANLPAQPDEAFFASKAREYLASPEHAEVLKGRLDELFRFSVTGKERVARRSRSDFGSFSELFRSMGAENRPWEQLVTSRSYLLTSPDSQSSERSYFLRLRPDLRPSSLGVFLRDRPPFSILDPRLSNNDSSEIRPGAEVAEGAELHREALDFEASDPRIAGVLTTPRFLSRYSNTLLNRNRRRAAAVFRVFLCDDMIPAVMGTDEASIFERIFGGAQPSAPAHPPIGADPAAPAEVRHATDPQCQACHQKLDPMGQVFSRMGLAPAVLPVAGAIVIPRTDGSRVEIPVRGVGDMADRLVQMPEYASCQVRHFWNWYVGQDVPLSESRTAELVEIFDRVGRRTNDFIAELVSLPEFRGITAGESPLQLARARVLPVLQRCTSCHGSELPAFTRFPLGGNSANHSRWLQRIESAAALNSARTARMPPLLSGWSLSDEEKDALRAWVRVERQGSSQVAQVQRVQTGQSGFGSTFHRFVRGPALRELLRRHFEVTSGQTDGECYGLKNGGRWMGDMNLASGMHEPPAPTPAFLQAYGECLRYYYSWAVSNSHSASSERWGRLTEEAKRGIFEQELRRALGHQDARLVHALFQQLGSRQDITYQTVANVRVEIRKWIATREEFLLE